MSTTKYIIDNQNSSLSGQSIVGNLSATTFYGDGSHLTGVIENKEAINILYSDLYNKIVSSGLTAGTRYRLTDYKSVNYVNGWNAMSNQTPASINYAGLIDGSFQMENGFNGNVNTIDFQRSNSYYFDGSTFSQILIQNNGEFVIGTNDFTIEWYQYLTTGSSCCPRVFSMGTYISGIEIAFSFEANVTLWWNSVNKIVTLNTSPLDTWCHFAITRQSGTVKVFQDGNKVFEELLNNDLQSISNLAIGSETNLNADGLFRGNITNFRFISGTSIYNSDFTPSIKPLYATDETILLLSVKDQNHLNENNVYGQNLNISGTSVNFIPTAPFTDYDVFVGGTFNTYKYNSSKSLIKLKSDGSIDESFYIGGKDYGFDAEVNVVKLLADGKVLVGGHFTSYSGTPNQYLVKLNTDGTLDSNFSTTITPNYIDNYVLDINIEDKTGNIFIGGSFSILNNQSHPKLAKLDPNGNLIDVFSVSFDSDVLTIEMFDDALYVGGTFANVNGSQSAGIAKLRSSTGLVLAYAAGTGFNDGVVKIKRNNTGTLICVGTFTSYNGSPCQRIINLNTDLSILTIYASGTNFDNPCYSLDVDYLDNMYVGGDFANYNGNAATRIAKLDSGGTIDLTFDCSSNGPVNSLSMTMNNRLFLGGNFTQINYPSDSPSIIRIMGDNLSPVYNSNDIHTSDEEVLYIKAISDSQIERISYSEKYPNDIIEYSPYTNVLGRNQQCYNGATLYDGTIVSGFNLLWDSINNQVYFEMPSDNPIYFGHFMYYYAEFANGDFSYYSSFTAEPVEPGFRIPQYNNTDGDQNFKQTNLIVSSGGTKIILTDLNYDDFLNYQIDTLYVESISKTVNCYGYITKRIDTNRNIITPFDFKNIKFRRYEMDLSSVNSNFGLYYLGTKDQMSFSFGGAPTYVETTGKYKDFYSFDNTYNSSELSERNIVLEGIGGPDGGNWYAGSYDNNVFLSTNYNNYIKGNTFNNNTFLGSCYENNLCGSYIYNNIFSENFYSNEFSGDMSCYENLFGSSFNKNTIINSYFVNNNIGFGFDSNIINQFFGYNVIGSYFSINRIYGDFQNNTIGNYFRYNDLNKSFTNIVTNGNFENNIILSTFVHNNLNTFQFNVVNAGVSYINTNNTIQYLTVNAVLFNRVFNSSTYIYGDYSKEIVKSSDSSIYIGFLSGSSKTYITPVTS